MKFVIQIVLALLVGVGIYFEYQQRTDLTQRADIAEKAEEKLNSQLFQESGAAKAAQDQLAQANQQIASLSQELAKAKSERDTVQATLINALRQPGAVPAASASPAAPAGPAASLPPTSGAVSAPVATPPPSTPLTNDNFSAYTPFLAILEGDEGRGSGFLAKLKDGPCLITNAHVISGNGQVKVSLMNGKSFEADSIKLAEGFDLVSIPNPTSNEGLDVTNDVAGTIAVGDDVVVLGNSMGAGVATVIKGKVTGIGPSLVEVDAPFVPGNSGSPVIHVKSGKVIGVATYSLITHQSDDGKIGTMKKIERRFAYRLDTVQQWTSINLQTFNDEGATCDAVESRTGDLINLAKDIDAHDKIVYGNYYSDTNSLKDLVKDFEEKISASQRTAEHYLQAKKEFLYFVTDFCTKDLGPISSADFDSYHKGIIKDQTDIRNDLAKYFRELTDALDNSSPH